MHCVVQHLVLQSVVGYGGTVYHSVSYWRAVQCVVFGRAALWCIAVHRVGVASCNILAHRQVPCVMIYIYI